MATPEYPAQASESEITALLRQMREVNASERALTDVYHTLYDLHAKCVSGDNSRVGVLLSDAVDRNAITTHYQYVLAPYDYMALEALGQSASVTAKKIQSQEDTARIFEFSNDREALTVDKMSEDVRLMYTPLDEEADTKIAEVLKDRRLESPVFELIEGALTESEVMDTLPEEGVTIGYIAPEKDIHGILQLLTDIGMINVLHVPKIYEKLSEGMSAIEVIQLYLQYGPNRVVCKADGVHFSRGGALGSWVHINSEAGEVGVGFAPNVSEQYYSESGYFDEELRKPFLDTDCGKELVSVLEEQGLMLHSRWVEAMTFSFDRDSEEESSSNTSVYAELTRKVAKWINRPDAFHIEEMFTTLDMTSVREMAATNVVPEAPKRISDEEVAGMYQKNIYYASRAVQRTNGCAFIVGTGVRASCRARQRRVIVVSWITYRLQNNGN